MRSLINLFVHARVLFTFERRDGRAGLRVFAAILLFLGPAAATRASPPAENIRLAVAKQLYRIPGGQTVRTSTSIGFVQYPFIPGHPQMLDWEETLSIADIALYEAKRDRNQWLGLAGTEKAAEYTSMKSALTAGLAVLQQEGCIIVRRRVSSHTDTVDLLRRSKRTPAVTI